MRYRYIFFPWYKQQVFAIELSFLAFRIYGPVRRLLNADFVWVLKTEPTCSRLRCGRGAGRLAATAATSATLAGVPFHPRDARGQEALTKNVASSPPVIRPPVRVTPYKAECRLARLCISSSTQSLIPRHLPPGHKQTASLNKTREGKHTPLYS